MEFSLDPATRERLRQIRELGRAHMRPLGLESDRLGRPIPPEDPFFKLLVQLGLGRTRWSGETTAEPAATPGPGAAR